MSALNGQALELEALDTRSGANAGFWLTLRDPVRGQETPARLKLHGMDSDVYRATSHALQRRRQEERAKDPRHVLSPEETEARVLELVAACTAGWEGVNRRGQEWAYAGPASAAELYRGWPWVLEQAHEAILNRANFLPGSASS